MDTAHHYNNHVLCHDNVGQPQSQGSYEHKTADQNEQLFNHRLTERESKGAQQRFPFVFSNEPGYVINMHLPHLQQHIDTLIS